MKEERRKRKEGQRLQRESAQKRREANSRKNDSVQTITNTRKLRRMSKKQKSALKIQ